MKHTYKNIYFVTGELQAQAVFARAHLVQHNTDEIQT